MRVKNFFVFILGIGILATSQANIVITGTRVIYPADKKTVSVELTNRDAKPALVQAWIDKGDVSSTSDLLNVPFVITPAITRVEGKTQQTLRIRYTGENLAKDRETLFYFNLLDIPPKPKKSEVSSGSYLQLTVRSKLKFFFRPTNLPYSVNEAYSKVTWKVSGNQLIAQNPTPYYITYSFIGLTQNEKQSTAEVSNPDMIAPFSTSSFRLTKSAKGNEKVQWNIINDFGGNQFGLSPLAP